MHGNRMLQSYMYVPTLYTLYWHNEQYDEHCLAYFLCTCIGLFHTAFQMLEHVGQRFVQVLHVHTVCDLNQTFIQHVPTRWPNCSNIFSQQY